jgi:serine/threonine protein kinase
MAFEMLTKKAPFPDHQGDILSRKRFDPATRSYLKDFHVEYSEELESIIERCLAVSIDRRYQQAEEIGTDIELLRNGKLLATETILNARRNKGFFTSEWRKNATETFTFEKTEKKSSFSWVSITNLIIGLSLIVVLMSLN